MITYNKAVQSDIKKIFSHSSTRYFAVGVLAFAVDYLLLLFLYYTLNIKLEVATAAGFITGFVVSFSANRQWVFGGSKHKKKIHRQIAEYLILLSFNFLFTVWGVSFLNNHGIRPFIGKLLVMALVMCWNYALFRWVIFVNHPEPME